MGCLLAVSKFGCGPAALRNLRMSPSLRSQLFCCRLVELKLFVSDYSGLLARMELTAVRFRLRPNHVARCRHNAGTL